MRKTPPRRRLPAGLHHWRTRAVNATRGRPIQGAPPWFRGGLRDWHRRIGLTAFAFLIWLAASGFLLSRSADLGLDRARIGWPWLMSLYGLHAELPQRGFSGGGHWLAQCNDDTVLDGHALPHPIEHPLGLAIAGPADVQQLFVASPDHLTLLSATGARIDELRAPLLPTSTIRRIGSLADGSGRIAIQDFDAWQSADAGETWSRVAVETVHWSQPVDLSSAQRGTLASCAAPKVSVEQMLVDLHSGRLFGTIGSWVITLVGVLALWLAPSGFWMWYRTRRRRRQDHD